MKNDRRGEVSGILSRPPGDGLKMKTSRTSSLFPVSLLSPRSISESPSVVSSGTSRSSFLAFHQLSVRAPLVHLS